ncbi:MAG: cupin domain-containing protein [Isosphaeraceae bacterium]
MAHRDFGLGALLAPVGVEDFFRDHWEKQPLLLNRGATGAYAGLLSRRDVEHVIAFTRPKFVDAGAFASEAPRGSTVVQGWLAERPVRDGIIYPGLDDLRRVYAQGKTVVIMTMQQRWMPIAAVCRSLEGVFHCPVHANLYMTPKGAQGFAAHYDPHEVFVLQLEGTKHWRLHGCARPLPLEDERFDAARDRLGSPTEVHLEPGDLLYLPRGFVHEAFTSESASMHLTIGVNVFRWADLLHEAVDLLARQDERLRAALPPGAFRGPDLPEAFVERFRELTEVFARGADVEASFRRLGDRFFGGLPALPDDSLDDRADPEEIGLDTELRRRPGLICRVVRDGKWVSIAFPGGSVGGPLRIAAALQFVAETERFAVRDLPGDLGPDAKLVLARRLLREGLLAVARDAPADLGPEIGETGPICARSGP